MSNGAEPRPGSRDILVATLVAVLGNAASLTATVYAGLLFTADKWEFAAVMAFIAWRTHTKQTIEIR